MFKRIVSIMFSKIVIISLFSCVSIILLIVYIFEDNNIILILCVSLFSLGILEEKSDLMAIKITSRIIVALIYGIVLLLLVLVSSRYLYNHVYIPYKLSTLTDEQLLEIANSTEENRSIPSVNPNPSALDDALKKIDEAIKIPSYEEPYRNSELNNIRNDYNRNQREERKENSIKKPSIQFY